MLNLTIDRVRGELLREWRESQKIDVHALASNANLSVAQIRQLESGGVSLFYTPSIKESAARKVATLLGGDPAAVIHARDDVASAPSASVLDELIEFSRPQTPWARWGPIMLPRSRWIAVLFLCCLLLVFLAWFEQTAAEKGGPSGGIATVAVPSPFSATSNTQTQQPLQPVPGATELAIETLPAASVASGVAGPVSGGGSAVVVAPAGQANLLQGSLCQQLQQSQIDTVLIPAQARKPGGLVHFVAQKEGATCVVDGAGIRTVFSLKANESRTVFGQPPWRVHFELPEQAQLFFQGVRLRMPDPGITLVELREGRHAP